MATWPTLPTFTSGPAVSTDLTKLATALHVIGDAWTADGRAASAIWQAATTNPAIGNGTVASRYILAGHLLIWNVRIVAGSTTTFGSGTWQLISPFTLKKSADSLMEGVFDDASTGDNYPAWFQGVTTTGLNGRSLVSPSGAGPVKFAVINSTTPIAPGSGDAWDVLGLMETA